MYIARFRPGGRDLHTLLENELSLIRRLAVLSALFVVLVGYIPSGAQAADGDLFELLPDGLAGRTWNGYNLSSATGFTMTGRPAPSRDTTFGTRVYSRRSDGTLLESIPNGANWNTYNLTSHTGAPPIADDPASVQLGGSQAVYAVGTDGKLLEFLPDGLAGRTWNYYDLTTPTGVGDLDGTPAVAIDGSGMRHVFVRNVAGDLYEFVPDGNNGRAWNAYDASSPTGAPALRGNPVTVVRNGTPEVFAVSGTGHLLHFTEPSVAGHAWSHSNLSTAVGVAELDDTPAAMVDSAGLLRAFARTETGHVVQFAADGRNGRTWNPLDLTNVAGAPLVDGPLSAIERISTIDLFATSTAGHVVEFMPDSLTSDNWHYYDLTSHSGAPVGGPLSAVAAPPGVRVYQGPREATSPGATDTIPLSADDLAELAAAGEPVPAGAVGIRVAPDGTAVLVDANGEAIASSRFSLGGLWRATKCVAAITWTIGSSILVASKIAKIKSLIKRLGGIRKTAKLLISKGTKAQKIDAIAAMGKGLASEFLGIAAIEKMC